MLSLFIEFDRIINEMEKSMTGMENIDLSLTFW